MMRALGTLLLVLLGLVLIVGSSSKALNHTFVTVELPWAGATGTVTSNPTGFSCTASPTVSGGEGTCTVEYSESTQVTLIIVPGPGAVISGTPQCAPFTPAANGQPATCLITAATTFSMIIRFVPDGPAPMAPTISQQPADVTANPGAAASFSVVAAGTAPFQYQWQRDGADIPGATAANYTLPAVALTDDGAVFRVIVTNAVGSVTSTPAVLGVGHGWRVIGGPVATTGSQAPTLAVDATGTPFVAYTQVVGPFSRMFVRRFDGADWVNVGPNNADPVDPSASSSARENALVIGADGQPIVAWIESSRVRVARWTGTSWNFIGDDLSIDSTDSFPLSGMQLERDGDDLVAAWIETLPGSPFPSLQLTVKRFDATTGTWSGGYVPNVGNASQLRLALDPDGMPVIAYVPRALNGNDLALQVVRQTLSGWAPVGGDVGPVPPFVNSSARVYGFDIRVSASGVPHVIGSVNGTSLFAYRFDTNGWQPLSGVDGVFVSLDPATQGSAAMAFARGTPGLLMAYARQERPAAGQARYVTEFLNWNGAAWQSIAEPASVTDNTAAISPALVSGQPMFAAEYRLSRIVVQKFVP